MMDDNEFKDLDDNDFEDLIEEVDSKIMYNDDEEGTFSLVSYLDAEILMHRDVHFGGKFEFMIDYYTKGGKGCRPDFDLENIERIQQIELDSCEDLAPHVLTGPEAERVAAAKNAYKDLRSLYEYDSKDPLPRLIADLILSEEEYPEEEIQKLVACNKDAVTLLLDLLRSEDFHDPLFPGYGDAPRLAARCLGMIGDEKGIIALFESIRGQDFEEEEEVLRALYHLGEPAKKFLMRIATSRPITQDNIYAAMALAQFSDDPKISSFCLHQLADPKILANAELAQYMVWGCEGLADPQERKQFAELEKEEKISSTLKQEIQLIVHKSRLC